MIDKDITTDRHLIPFTPKTKRSKNLTGKTFNRLSVLGFAGYFPQGNNKYADPHWLCQCSCDGKLVTIAAHGLLKGTTGSCGCWKPECTKTRSTTHGFKAGGKVRPEYSVWCQMKQRCLNTNDKAYRRYGAAGRKVCAGFMLFENFITIVGERPDEHKLLDRENNKGNYSCGQCEECIRNEWPLNVRWVTSIVSANNTGSNKRLTYRGCTHTLAEWCAILGLPYGTVQMRLYRGRTVEDAFYNGKLERKRPPQEPSAAARVVSSSIRKNSTNRCK